MPQSSPWQYARDFAASQNQQNMHGQQLMQQLMMQQIAGQNAAEAARAEQQAKLPQHVLSNLGNITGAFGNVGAEGLLRQVLGQEQPIADPGLLQEMQGQTLATGDAGIFKDKAAGVGSLAGAGFAPGDLNALFGMDIQGHTRPADIFHGFPPQRGGSEPKEEMGTFEFSADGGRFRVPVPLDEARAKHEIRMGRMAPTAGTRGGNASQGVQGEGPATEVRGTAAARITDFERRLEDRGYRRETALTKNAEGGSTAMYINERENKRVRVHYTPEGEVIK